MLTNFSEITIGGFLTKDSEQINNEKFLAFKTTVAINTIPKKDVVFIEVIFNGKNVKVASTLKKGDYIIVKGQIKQKIFTKDGYNFIKTYLVVDKIYNISKKNEKETIIS